MSGDRVQDALAAYMEHRELGTPEPDVSGLSADEHERLRQLIELLDETEGVALGRGLETDARAPVGASSEAGRTLLATLRDALPLQARITDDPAASAVAVTGMDVTEGFIVGTFGGRVRVWLVAGTIAETDEWLRDLGRVFRLFPDTAAVALVDQELMCLLVQPEDCAPTIEVPRGSLVGRRYRRPVHPVAEALPVFLRELIPDWEPVSEITGGPSRTIAVRPIADERAGTAIAEQVAAGGRARKTNPKRTALIGLGDTESRALTELVVDVHEGRATLDDVEEKLRRSAARKR